MGADGHIAYFDAEKVRKILAEVKAKYPVIQELKKNLQKELQKRQ